MTEKNYWYINKDYGDETDINKGLDWLLEMCKKYNCQKCFLAVYSNQNLGGMIQNVLGIKNVNRLKANKEVFLKDILLKVITERSNVYSLDGPVLIAFPTKNLETKEFSGYRSVYRLHRRQHHLRYVLFRNARSLES